MPRKSLPKSTSSTSLIDASACGGGDARSPSAAAAAGEETGSKAGLSYGNQAATAKRVEAQQANALKDHGIDQFELPKSVVTRLAKSEIPESVQLRKEVVTALVKASTVFISYLTATSHDQATTKGHKTISAANVLEAVRELELPDEFRGELKRQLEAYRTLQKQKRKAPSSTTSGVGGGGGGTATSGSGAKKGKSKAGITASARVGDESMDADVSRLTNNVDDDEDEDEEGEEDNEDDEEGEDGEDEQGGAGRGGGGAGKKARRDGEDGEMLRGKLHAGPEAGMGGEEEEEEEEGDEDELEEDEEEDEEEQDEEGQEDAGGATAVAEHEDEDDEEMDG